MTVTKTRISLTYAACAMNAMNSNVNHEEKLCMKLRWRSMTQDWRDWKGRFDLGFALGRLAWKCSCDHLNKKLSFFMTHMIPHISLNYQSRHLSVWFNKEALFWNSKRMNGDSKVQFSGLKKGTGTPIFFTELLLSVRSLMPFGPSMMKTTNPFIIS